MVTGGEKPWLREYTPGVKHELGPIQFKNLPDYFADIVRRFGDRPAFVNMGTSLSYNEADRLSRQFAAYLIATAGLKRGDRIALQMPNILQYIVALLGALRAGLIVVNINPLYTPREMQHQLRDSGAKAIVILENFAHNLEQIVALTEVSTVVVTGVGDLLKFPKGALVNFVLRSVKKVVPRYKIPGAVSFRETLARGARASVPDADLGLDDLAFLQYTGGTTGVSKGAMLSHRNILANAIQMGEYVGYRVNSGQEVVVTPLPLYHIFSLSVNIFGCMQFGVRNVLITNPKDIPAFVKELKTARPTLMTGVNTLFNALLNNEEFRKLDFSSLKLVPAAGMAVQRSVAERWKAVTGTPLVEGYGLTETSPVLCLNRVDGTEVVGSIGLPMPSTDVSIRDEAGNEVAMGEPGELWARGPQIMQGYWQRPDETAHAMCGDWLKTGDIATMDARGFFRIVDRKKDMIIVSGFKVYPNEVEDVIAAHPAVLEVAAVGFPDERSGEAVKVFIVTKGAGLSAADLKAYCQKNLTAYKVPKYYEFRATLPKSPVGKILRRELRDEK